MGKSSIDRKLNTERHRTKTWSDEPWEQYNFPRISFSNELEILRESKQKYGNYLLPLDEAWELLMEVVRDSTLSREERTIFVSNKDKLIKYATHLREFITGANYGIDSVDVIKMSYIHEPEPYTFIIETFFNNQKEKQEILKILETNQKLQYLFKKWCSMWLERTPEQERSENANNYMEFNVHTELMNVHSLINWSNKSLIAYACVNCLLFNMSIKTSIDRTCAFIGKIYQMERLSKNKIQEDNYIKAIIKDSVEFRLSVPLANDNAMINQHIIDMANNLAHLFCIPNIYNK